MGATVVGWIFGTQANSERKIVAELLCASYSNLPVRGICELQIMLGEAKHLGLFSEAIGREMIRVSSLRSE